MSNETEYKWVNASNDRCFKEVFYKEENKHILKEILEYILKLEIHNIEIINNEKNRGNVNIKGMRTDLSLDTNEGYINVEVNSTFKDYVHTRNFSYLADTYSHNMLVGENYNEKTKFTQINLSYGLMLNENNKLLENPKETKELNEYKVMTKEGKEYIKNFTIYEINMDYFLDLWYNKKKKKYGKEKYLIMLGLDNKNLKELSKNDGIVKEYMENVDRVNEDPRFREYMSYEEDQRKIQNTLREEAIQEGLKEGLEKGIEKGLKEGIDSRNIEIAKNMLKKNMSIEDISEITNLSKEEIEKLK